MKPWLLLDGDLILFRSAIVCEQETKWDEENWLLWLNEEKAWANIQAVIEGFRTVLSASRVTLLFTEGRCFRYSLVPDYKAHRVGTRKPLGYRALVERAKAAYEHRSIPGLEADDVMGILSTTPGKTPKIIVSDDKDMKTIPGQLYRQGRLLTISAREADYWHYYQTLIGDTADGFKGLPGCGEKTAAKLLEAPEGLEDSAFSAWAWAVVVEAYGAKGLTEADALTQARLARILRASDWNNITKEPILWVPPTLSVPGV